MATSSITKEYIINDPKELDRLWEIEQQEAIPLDVDRELLQRGMEALEKFQFN